MFRTRHKTHFSKETIRQPNVERHLNILCCANKFQENLNKFLRRQFGREKDIMRCPFITIFDVFKPFTFQQIIRSAFYFLLSISLCFWMCVEVWILSKIVFRSLINWLKMLNIFWSDSKQSDVNEVFWNRFFPLSSNFNMLIHLEQAFYVLFSDKHFLILVLNIRIIVML